MRGDVVCACTTHPQSSTVIIIYSGRCPHNKLHGSYIFITMVRAKFSYVPCFIIVKKLKLLEPRSLAGTHVFSKRALWKVKVSWSVGTSRNVWHLIKRELFPASCGATRGECVYTQERERPRGGYI